MSFHIYHRFGESESDPPPQVLEALYDELQTQDNEHPDVIVEHESGWALSAFPSGLLVWENIEDEDGSPRHMKLAGKDEVLDLWHKLARGEIAAIEAEPWEDGYG